MIDPAIKAIIFDFGGVLINIDYRATIHAFEQLGIEDFEERYSQADQSHLFNDLETGKISPQRFINGLLDLLPPGTSPNKVVEAWNAMILDVPAEAVTLLLRLKSEGYEIYLLSNTNEIHIDLAYRRWAMVSEKRPEKIFNHVYLSHEMGLRKPSKAIFERVCAEQKLNLEETLFIDDSMQHIEGAAQCGLQTHHLTDQKALYTLFS